MDDRAHHFAARRAALNGEAAGRCEAGLDQPARAIDEIVEGVGAFFQLAVQIPAIAHVVAAPDVRDRIGEAPVQQGQASGGKDRKSVVKGKSVYVRGDLGGRRNKKKKKKKNKK